MVEHDGERQAITVVGFETRPLVAIDDFDRPRNADELLGSILFLDPGRLDQEDEQCSRAVEDGYFRCIEIDPGVVDAKPGKSRHQVLDGANLDPVLFETGAHTGIADHESGGGNIHRLGKIDATKDDAGIRGSGAQGHIDLDTAVQTDAGGADDSLQRALLEHAST